MKEHKCGPGGHSLPLLPDRVIWAQEKSRSLQLIESTSNMRGHYIALSYCWGPVASDTYLTNSSTFQARKAGIQYNDLPPLFQDVVDIAFMFGIEYIWIDRLCIIQGDKSDFKCQAPKMGEIYGNASFTIAAASATSENDRISMQRDSRWRMSANLSVNVLNVGTINVGLRRRSYPIGQEAGGGNYGKISSRAWIWQERLLSARTVFYTPSELKFECRCHSVWEGSGQGVTGPSWSAQLDNNISHASWLSLVEEYTSRDIYYPSDRLPAIESVMKRIQKSQGWTPFCGLWANKLVDGLAWKSMYRDAGPYRMNRMNPEYYAPTWSWAGVDAVISYSSARASEEEIDPMVYDLEVVGLNVASEMITVSGHVGRLKLVCTVEPSYNPSDKFWYRYELHGAYGDPYPVDPDVPLKPWIDDVTSATPVRVPYGEAPPEKSWSANCVCLLLSRRQLRSVVLLLGHSMRQPGGAAWERIGLVSGLNPVIFQGTERMLINLI